MTDAAASGSDVERLLARTIGNLVALEETVRALGRQPERLVAMREAGADTPAGSGQAPSDVTARWC